MDAHGAEKPVGQDGGRMADAPSVRADRAFDLAPQARQGASAFRPRGETFFGEIRVVICGKCASSGS